MATVAELLDYSLRVASLNTSNTTDTMLVTRFLNDGYQRAVGHTGVSTVKAVVTPLTPVDTLVASSYAQSNRAVNTVQHVFLQSSGFIGRELQRVSTETLITHRDTTAISTTNGPVEYSVRGNGDIEVWPAVVVGNVFSIELELQPPTLVAVSPLAGQEIVPSLIPPMFHYDVIGAYAISRALEYRGLTDRATYFRSQAENGIRELGTWLNDQGGIMGPDVKLIRNVSGYGSANDQKW